MVATFEDAYFYREEKYLERNKGKPRVPWVRISACHVLVHVL